MKREANMKMVELLPLKPYQFTLIHKDSLCGYSCGANEWSLDVVTLISVYMSVTVCMISAILITVLVKHL